MAAIDPARIRTIQDLAEQLAVLSARYPHGVQRLAADAGLGTGTVQDLIKGRTAIPRVGTLKSFVETCGQDAGPWLAARARLVAAVRSEKVKSAPDLDRRPTGPLGRVIGELDERDALALEVHQAFAATGATPGAVSVLPPYLPRAGFDDRLRKAVAAAEQGSRLVMVVGDSSTGKTRACWEAIRAELPGWRVWHPLTPGRPMAVVEALRSGRVAARSVIWLNELQLYLQPSQVGELVAAELQALLADASRGPVLVLGSMWPEFRRLLTTTPQAAAASNPHRAARALLGLGEEVTAPACFTSEQLTDLAAAVTADPRLATAAKRARGGQITQELAGAPELLSRYQQGSAVAKAVLWAAMDARRLGHGLYLPEPLLRDAAPAYLDDHTWDQVGGTDWFITALDELTAQIWRLPGPLIEHRPRPGETLPPAPLYRLADYLEQHGRRERVLLCPPPAFWDAAAHHARTPADLATLAQAAVNRGRYQHAARLRRQAATTGEPAVLAALAEEQQYAGNRDLAERLFRQATEARHVEALLHMSRLREEAGDREEAELFARQAADAGHPNALTRLANSREDAERWTDAERLAREAAGAGDPAALKVLVRLLDKAGDREGAERFARQAAEAGHPDALTFLAQSREKQGDRKGAERLYRQAADAGDSSALRHQAWLREKTGDREGAERLNRQAIDSAHPALLLSIDVTDILTHPAFDGLDLDWLERVARQAADAGDPLALKVLVRLREKAGNSEEAERFALQAAEAGRPDALTFLAQSRRKAGDRVESERFARLAAAGDPDALVLLAQVHEEAGNREEAERFARQAAEAGQLDGLMILGWSRREAKNWGQAERLYLRANDAGNRGALLELARVREEAGDREGADRLRRFGLDANEGTDGPWSLSGGPPGLEW